MTVIEKKTDLQKSKIHHLEDTMIMYGVYNSDTLTALIRKVQNMQNRKVQNMQNRTTWNEKTFAGKLTEMNQYYLKEEGTHIFAINSMLFLTTVREKYVKIYEIFIEELKIYSKAIRILIYRLPAYIFITPIKTTKAF